jgi:hypothetical protein
MDFARPLAQLVNRSALGGLSANPMTTPISDFRFRIGSPESQITSNRGIVGLNRS